VVYADFNSSLREVRASFPDRPTPSAATIIRIVNNFRGNGCVQPEHNRRNRSYNVLNAKKKNEIMTLIP